MKYVRELNKDELYELKCKIFYEEDLSETISDEEIIFELGHALLPDDISDETIYKLYSGVCFVEEDFWCNLKEK